MLVLFSLYAFALRGLAGDMSLVGTHPTSPLTAFPDIHVLKAYQDRIYMGYGDWNVYPAVVVVSYDPAINAFRIEHSAVTDSVGTFRILNNRLYVPSIDPIHFEDFNDYSVLENGVWRSFTPSGFFHVLDMGTATGSDLWMVGAKSPNETASANGAVLRSVDGGRNWTDVSANATVGRYYYGFALNGAFYVADRVYRGSVVTPQALPYTGFHKATTIGSGNGVFALGLVDRYPGLTGITSNNLATFDGIVSRVVRTNVHDWTLSGSTVYTLEVAGNGMRVSKGSSVSVAGATWELVPLAMPTNARALEVLGDVLYIGDAQGQLWAGRLDGSAIGQGPAEIINELPDAFGRALAISGQTLAVGAPDFSGAAPLSGQVTLWQQTNGGWQLEQTINPAPGSFSGWFGKDVALAGDAMAVLEAGKDFSGFDRGSASQVHLYECVAGVWQQKQSIGATYAHGVALSSNRLAIATSTQLLIYRLTQTNGLQATRETNLVHNVTALYEPTGRVALDGDRVAYGLAGDFSRFGGPGQVNVYERNVTAGWRVVATLVQNAPPSLPNLTRAPDAFGFAVAIRGDWLAVGAPRDDNVAAQAGAVHIYQRVISGSTVSYVLRQTIACPVAQAEARFGSSVALTDTNLVIGAPGIDVWNRQEGKVFIYERQGSNWMAVREMGRPVGAQGEFGRRVAAATDLVLGGCQAAAGYSGVESRVAISPWRLDSATLADLAVSQLISPSLVTNGSSVTCYITVSNAGPATATGVQLIIDKPLNLLIEGILSSRFACTNTGTGVRCTLDSLAAGTSEALVVSGRADLEGPCEQMRSDARVFAREFDGNEANNFAVAFASYELPEARVAAPTNGTIVPFRGPVEMRVETSGSPAIRSVEFFANDNFVGAVTSLPYTFVWTNGLPGTNRLSARATSDCGTVSTSAVVMVIMETNVLPQVAILHPATGTRFPAGPVDIPIYVTAADADGVTRVDLLWNNLPLKIFFGPPYYYVRSNTVNGSYGLKVIARDGFGGSATSLVSRIVVGPENEGATNWVAYNDHSPGPGTRSTATRWDIQGAPPGSGGSLRNVASGATLPSVLSITRSDATLQGSPGIAPDAGSPAANLFGGNVDFVTGTAANVSIAGAQLVRYSFGGLDPNLRYNFDGTAVRGELTYTDRWTLVELTGARSFRASHTRGCLTEGTGTIASNQAALNTGDNRVGEMVGWHDIQPDRNGTFSILCSQYTGAVPNGSGSGSNGYALTAVRLEEISMPAGAPPGLLTQPISLTVSPGAGAQFEVVVFPPEAVSYQWVHNGTPIPGATTNRLQIDPVSTNDAGFYVVIVEGEAGSVASVPGILTTVEAAVLEQGADRLAQLAINGATAQRYRIDFRPRIDGSASWLELTNFALPSPTMLFKDESSRNAATRFYRVVPLAN
jgi:hypothetical protein